MEADIYLDRINLNRYWPESAEISCEKAVADVSSGKTRLENYSFLSRRQIQAFQLVIEAKSYLPEVPMTTVPRPIKPEIIPLNGPDENSLVVITGNNQHTLDVLMSVWAQGGTPAYLVMVDCLGGTVDMAMVFGDFTKERLRQALINYRLEEMVSHRHLVVPGFTAPLVSDFEQATGWEIEVGPVCAVELPLALGDRWVSSV